MGVGNNAAAIAAEIEAIRPELPELVLFASVLWGKLEANNDLTPVSSRPTRVPLQTGTGGIFGVFGPDGTDMGTGSGLSETPGYISCAFYSQCTQWTALAEWSTDSSAKAIANYVALNHKQAAKTLGGYLDVLAQGDASNTIDTIVSVGAGQLVVNNANYFQTNQLIDIWTAVGGAFVTTLQVATVDPQTNSIWTTSAVPGGVVAGQVIMVHGASGQANTGILGLKYYNVASNTGNFLGIPRPSFPGVFTAQNINRSGGALTPASVIALQSAVELAMGPDIAAEMEPVAHCNVDMRNAWELLALNVNTNIYQEVKGDENADMLKKQRPKMMGGRPILLNPRATPGRIDFVDMKNMSRVEVRAADYYDVNGQTVFPTIGASGGINSSNLFYLVFGGNLLMNNPRLSSFMSNVAIPSGVFGK
jgi:hypothetical protein